MDTSFVSGAFAMLYDDRMDVQRRVQSKAGDGSTVTGPRQTVTGLTNIPCRISYKMPDTATNPENGEQVRRQVQVFFAPDIDILAGDYLILRRITGGAVRQTLQGNAGKPGIYGSHCELLLEDVQWA
jgi:hypothetical protein